MRERERETKSGVDSKGRAANLFHPSAHPPHAHASFVAQTLRLSGPFCKAIRSSMDARDSPARPGPATAWPSSTRRAASFSAPPTSHVSALLDRAAALSARIAALTAAAGANTRAAAAVESTSASAAGAVAAAATCLRPPAAVLFSSPSASHYSAGDDDDNQHHHQVRSRPPASDKPAGRPSGRRRAGTGLAAAWMVAGGGGGGGGGSSSAWPSSSSATLSSASDNDGQAVVAGAPRHWPTEVITAATPDQDPPPTTTATSTATASAVATATAAASAGDVTAWLDALRCLVLTAGPAGATAGLMSAVVGVAATSLPPAGAADAVVLPPPPHASGSPPRAGWSPSSSPGDSPFRVAQAGERRKEGGAAEDEWGRTSSSSSDRVGMGGCEAVDAPPAPPPPPADPAPAEDSDEPAVRPGAQEGQPAPSESAPPAQPIVFGSWGAGEVPAATKASAGTTTATGAAATTIAAGPVAVHASAPGAADVAPPAPVAPAPPVVASLPPPPPRLLEAPRVAAFAAAVLGGDLHTAPPDGASIPLSLRQALADAAREAWELEGEVVRPASGRRTGPALVAAASARVARWATVPVTLDDMLAEDAADDAAHWRARPVVVAAGERA